MGLSLGVAALRYVLMTIPCHPPDSIVIEQFEAAVSIFCGILLHVDIAPLCHLLDYLYVDDGGAQCL